MRRSRLTKVVKMTILLLALTLLIAEPASSESMTVPIQNPDNGHYYELVEVYGTGVNWSEARDAAASRSHLALQGYLATITSQSEQSFVEQLLDQSSFNTLDSIWLGGNDAAQEGTWKWVTGPEADTQFWQGNQDGFPIGGAYTNWETLGGFRRQPDDAGDEDFLSIEFNSTPGSWPSDEKYQWNDADANRIGPGYLVEYSPSATTVPFDIKPGSDPNSINCRNRRGVIPVAILTTDDFDATMVDHTTVTFEGANETHVNKKTGEPRRHEKDVDGDGDIDLVFHFRLGDTALTCDSTEGSLMGETFDGMGITGTDSVRMIKRRGKKP